MNALYFLYLTLLFLHSFMNFETLTTYYIMGMLSLLMSLLVAIIIFLLLGADYLFIWSLYLQFLKFLFYIQETMLIIIAMLLMLFAVFFFICLVLKDPNRY